MNTKDSYLFTDLDLAKEAADYQAEMFGVRMGVFQVDPNQFIVSRNYAIFDLSETLYVAEAPE